MEACQSLYHFQPLLTFCHRDLADVAIELGQNPSEEPDRDAYLNTALAVLIAAVERGATSPAVLGPLAAAIDNRFRGDPKLTRQLIRMRSWTLATATWPRRHGVTE